MGLTDESLKRIKDQYSKPGDILMLSISAYDLLGMLVRFGAAEDVCKAFDTIHPRENCGCSYCDLLDNWDKAKGL